jgi:DnaJ family protein C protein 11
MSQYAFFLCTKLQESIQMGALKKLFKFCLKVTLPYVYSENVRFPTIEVSGMSITQSIEAPLTLRDTMTMSGQLSTQNGTGTGSVVVSLRRLLSEKGWLEVDFGAGNGPTFTLKGFRTLTKRTFSNMATVFHFTPHGIRPDLVTSKC